MLSVPCRASGNRPCMPCHAIALREDAIMKCRWVKQAIHAELDALTEEHAGLGDGLPVEFEVDSVRVVCFIPPKGFVPPAACPYTSQCMNAICTHGYS